MTSSIQRLFPACGRLGRIVVSAAVLAFAGAAAIAQTCAFPGADGSASVSGVPNSYHSGVSAGANQVTVSSIAGQRTNTRNLRVGDLILIMQMQDSTGARAGLHEYAQIVSIAGNVLTLNRTLTNTYTKSIVAGGTWQTFQVIYVPQYASATVSGATLADPWNITNDANQYSTGGVVALDAAGDLTISSTVSANGAGFRGGAGIQGTATRAGGLFNDANYAFNAAAANGAVKGEGTVGTPFVVLQNNVTTAAIVTYPTGTFGQGYAGGAAGQQAQGNAGGGGNDGNPPSGASNNGFNSGGGGGSNSGAGGTGGNSWNASNAAGGRGAPAVTTNGVARVAMGGGGGAGSTNNNAGANTITTWPAIVNGTTRPVAPTTGTANGASGPISSSGMPGGGVVLIRAGRLLGAGSISANGYTAYNVSGTSSSESGGGGGAGGSIVLMAGSGTGAGLSASAVGGGGGYSNYYDHGPGGGGGGGFIYRSTNLTGVATSVVQGADGYDGCCGGTQGNGSPKNYGSTDGAVGSVVTAGGSATGVQGGAACLPAIVTTKTALSPTITAATGATTQYTINLTNTGGAASNLYLVDATLPPGWAYTTSVAPTYAYSPAPPGAASTGAETTAAVMPAGYPVAAYTSANSNVAVSLLGAGAAPGVVPAAGDNSLRFGSFYLPQGGSLTVTFAVSIPDTATVGTYHNPGGVVFLDPTRDATLRAVTPASNATANRTNTAYSNTTYFSGSTTAVAGANYNGQAAGPTTDDVRLLPDFSVTKTAPATVTAGATFTYTITPRNNGRPIATQAYATTQATDAAASALGSNPLTITDTLPAGVTVSTAFNGTGYVCTGTTPVVCTRSNANAYPIAAATDYPSITATMTLTATCTPAPSPASRINTVTISVGAGETATANNTGTATTAIGCYTANIQITKTNSVTSLSSGQATSYAVTVSNAGPGNVPAGTIVRDTASAGLACTAVTCSSATAGLCPASPTTYAAFNAGLALGAFPSGTQAVFNVSCTVSATGS